MTSPCPVCGRALPATTAGRVPWHRTPDGRPDLAAIGPMHRCPGSGALAAAGDLFPDAPAVAPLPAPGAQSDLFPEG